MKKNLATRKAKCLAIAIVLLIVVFLVIVSNHDALYYVGCFTGGVIGGWMLKKLNITKKP